jgi:RNA polymerase sigma-70 factor (ECF subfamily)
MVIGGKGQPMLSDRDLVQRILERDERALEALLAQHGEAIQRHLARIVGVGPNGDDAAAQDLAQETWLRVWQRAEQWDGRGSFAGWLYRIATNLAYNYLRSVKRRREEPLDAAQEGGAFESNASEGDEPGAPPGWLVDDSTLAPEDALEEAEERERLRQLVGGLALDKREVLVLVNEMGLSLQAAAEALGIPEGTAKSRLHYAKKTLARLWQDQENHREMS